MTTVNLATSSFIDWEELTGQSRFVIDMVSIPIFSAIAGLITNWTGVWMLFSPTHFTGFYVPGLKTLFPLLPRKVQILPIFAPNGILGFQGFIPCRAEKMASLIVDMSIARIGGIGDFYQQLEPDKMAELMAKEARPHIARIAGEVINSNHRWLWDALPAPAQQNVIATIEARVPAISQRAFARVGDHIDDLLNVKLMTVNHLRRNPAVLSDIFKGMGAPELRFMVKIGALGFFFGIPLALYLNWIHEYHPPVLSAVPSWFVVLAGAAVIGVVVNILAIKIVFEPGSPQPRYKYLWKQGIFPKRQHEAAAQVATMMSEKVLTVTNFTRELLFGASGDKTASYLAEVVAEEVDQIFSPLAVSAGQALGVVDWDDLERKVSTEIVDLAPEVFYSEEFNEEKAKKIADFATTKFRELPPDEFSEMLYAAIEQDAWLLYVHGGLLGILVGATHLLLFGW
ncbi:hypothetical protein MMAG44476_13701 [Mycolicibacterium mageritense DSM 44476 = CIP 104973]|uniref:DUF445 domain-containing protein n=1 Tax=Mycolicibacterium mageritense TaxID=53462 RepID=A0ABM7HUN5_MYCME|nr:hypothetical protein [Mycolicibacterium mageritense]MCC9181813.1 hypothetical protein [Mycolicibacterium mageritense]BBX34306.1 hypothetical protein MMAGJ_35880 [Mycolicibacterium mageritense]GJJ18785.1 hypothetical protein MTY414_24580 [Mycolicibacterium mageritense]CDO21173.1 hypothetical protein BN978_01632 [Mycolicibacterium mageritense DSM 44476 = CIP 104973]